MKQGFPYSHITILYNMKVHQYYLITMNLQSGRQLTQVFSKHNAALITLLSWTSAENFIVHLKHDVWVHSMFIKVPLYIFGNAYCKYISV